MYRWGVCCRSCRTCPTSARAWWRGVWGKWTWETWVWVSYRSLPTTSTHRSRVRSKFTHNNPDVLSVYIIHFYLCFFLSVACAYQGNVKAQPMMLKGACVFFRDCSCRSKRGARAAASPERRASCGAGRHAGGRGRPDQVKRSFFFFLICLSTSNWIVMASTIYKSNSAYVFSFPQACAQSAETRKVQKERRLLPVTSWPPGATH